MNADLLIQTQQLLFARNSSPLWVCLDKGDLRGVRAGFVT